MKPEEYDRLLRQTLEDYRLSHGEKRALSQCVTDSALSENQLAALRSRAFALAAEQAGDPAFRQLLEWLGEVLKAFQPRQQVATTASEAYFSPDSQAPLRIAECFTKAVDRVDVCVFTITDDRISRAILDAHQRGIALRIISDNDKAYDLGSDIQRFEDAGIQVRVDHTPAHMHHKFAIFDQQRLLTGSYNWTRGAAEENRDNYILTRDSILVARFGDAFDRLWHELA